MSKQHNDANSKDPMIKRCRQFDDNKSKQTPLGQDQTLL